MFTTRKIVLSAAIILSTALGLATSAAFANAREALTSNVTVATHRLSDAYRMNGSCEAGSPAAPWPRPPWLVDTRMVRGYWPD